jgi:3-hydroxy-9,10-secoandrosta-1,3,5(10)-triene-9,17-dione monooxygenase
MTMVHQPTRADLVARATALRPLLQVDLGAAERDRRMPKAVVDALTEAGFYRLMTPRHYGGYQTDVRTVVEVAEVLGGADGSAAWDVANSATTGWSVAALPERGRQEIFGAGPDTRVAGSSTPVAARRVEGGVRVGGRWGFSTGCDHADWLTLAAVVPAGGGGHDTGVMCFVPRDQVRIDDTWRTVGMRGTGSNTVVADDVFVPDHRIVALADLVDGRAPRAGDTAIDHLTFGPLATLTLIGPLLGMGSAAFAHVVANSAKPMHHTVFARRSDSVGVQCQIAEAALTLRTARLHTYDAVDELDRAAAGGDARDYDMRARIRAQCGYAAQQVLAAIKILVNVHGAGSFAEASPVQQIWRDANTAARHAGIHATVGLEVYGKALLSVDERISPVV